MPAAVMFGALGSVGKGPSTLLYQGHTPLNLYFRPLQPSDYEALKALHRDLFPIDYEDGFFFKAVSSEDRVFSWAAIHTEFGRDQLVGFVTARLVYLYECDPVDRQVMGVAHKALDGHSAVYVLTLGVEPACRQCGIARNLLRLVHQHAERMRCCAIFLHVIAYNEAAMRLYGSSGYQVMARLPNFYHLTTGRQPNPDQSWHDAFLYAASLPRTGPEPSPAAQWAGGVLGAAVAPLRSVLGTFNGCMPAWLCRNTLLPFSGSLQPPPPPPPRTPSKSSLADTATSAWQQQAPPTPPASPYRHQQQRQPPQTQDSVAGSAGTATCQQSSCSGEGAASAATAWGPHAVNTAQTGSQTAQATGPWPGPLLHPPSPLVASGHSSPGMAALQQRHPHGSGGSTGGPGTPRYLAPGGPGCHPQAGQNGSHHHGHGHGQHHSQHHHQHQQGQAYGGGGGSGGASGGSYSGHQGQGQAYSRHGEHGRGGAGQRAPHGLAGGGLQHPYHHQQQQQQQSGSLLSALLRPPSAQAHPHSR